VRVRFTSRALCEVTHSSQVYIRTASDGARQGIRRLVVDTKDTFKDNGDRETISRLSRSCELQKQFASRIANHMERVKSIAHQCLCFDNLEVLTNSPRVAHHCLGSFITVLALYIWTCVLLHVSGTQWKTRWPDHLRFWALDRTSCVQQSVSAILKYIITAYGR
jgi:hypothetical protein